MPPPQAPSPPTVSNAPPKPLLKNPYVLLAIALVVLVVVAAVVVAFLFAPFSTWSTGQTMQDSNAGVNSLNFNFQTDVGRVNVMTQKLGGDNVLIHVSANGSQGFLEGGAQENSVSISFENQTVGDVLTVNCEVHLENPSLLHANVVCDIFVDPALTLKLNVSSSAGQISFVADKATTIQALNLHANAGEVQANLESNVNVAGDISLKSGTGAIHYRMSETNVEGNHTLDLQSNVGSVYMDIIQTKNLHGNLQVNASTHTGSIDVGLAIDGGVGAKITSQTAGMGDINVKSNNFSGNKSPIQSNNFPANSNIEINNTISGFGSVNIKATYLTTVISA
jgi:hypothetical protein